MYREFLQFRILHQFYSACLMDTSIHHDVNLTVVLGTRMNIVWSVNIIFLVIC
jgi:hypothetical protein